MEKQKNLRLILMQEHLSIRNNKAPKYKPGEGN